MNLELRKIAIKDIQFGDEEKIVDGCLYVDPKKLEELSSGRQQSKERFI